MNDNTLMPCRLNNPGNYEYHYSVMNFILKKKMTWYDIIILFLVYVSW